MKIHGAEGLSAGDIRDEINRGGRLVVYQYCVSILVVTFKRPTGVRLIKAGQSPGIGGLPFTLISLVGGWWGIPWGPIYTVQSIYRNLSGGIDVTDAVLRSLFPAAPPPVAAAAPTLHAVPAPPARKANTKVIAFMVSAAAALIVGGISLFCYYRTQNLTVVLVSGVDRPYTVTLNGVAHQLNARSSEILTLPEGTITLEDAPGGTVVGSPKTLVFALPFFAHLDETRLAIVNPDRAAVLFNEDVSYYGSGTTPPAREEPAFSVLANQQSYFIEKPDFVLELPPQNLSMPSGTSRMVKTRLEHVRQAELPQLLNLLQQKLNYSAARDHLMIQARYRTDEAFLSAAVQTLKPADFRAFFQIRLADRPVLVEWHRYYQNVTERVEPEVDLAREYRAYLEAAPGDSALLYLLGRVTTARAEARQLYAQALAARPACAYAHGALAYDAMSDGNFAEALAHYEAAESAGLASQAFRHYRRQAYWGLHQFEPLRRELQTARTANPFDLELAAEEISVVLASGQDVSAAQKICGSYLAALKAQQADSKSLAECSNFLQAGIAYQTGHLPEYAKLVAQLDGPAYKFRAAFTRGDLAGAAQATLAEPNPSAADVFLLYLLAKHQGNEVEAGKFFARALGLMNKDSRFKPVAAQLASPQRPAPEALAELAAELPEKCVFFTAFGVWDPEHQKRYHALAASLDILPEFPHQFLRDILKPASAPAL